MDNHYSIYAIILSRGITSAFLNNLKMKRLLVCGIMVNILLLHTACINYKTKNNHSFNKSGEAVLNPGQGWILYGDPSDHSTATLAVGTTGYNRYSWSQINPQENVYNWSHIDNMINAWAKLGKQFAFGIMSVYCPGEVYCTPKWIFDKGAKYTMGNSDEKSTERKYFIPVWDDPVYVEECKKFAEALAKRYDGNPNIAFIEIRNYGNWGEMHMWPFSQHTRSLTAEQVQTLLIQPYLNNFKNTQLGICWGEPPLNNSINHWVVEKGIALRNDGIMGDKSSTGHSGNGDVISMAIGKTPVIWEFIHTSFKKLENHSDYPWDDKRFINIIKTGKPNYIGLGGWGNDAQYMLSRKPELVREVANLMGFNFSITTASYANEISAGKPLEISLSIENSGVTNMLTDCVIKILLLDSDDKAVSSYTTDWNTKSINGGKTENFSANAIFSDVSVGTYKLSVGLYRNENDPKPTYNLDEKDRTHDGFYVIGTLKIEP